jgi:uncharacterized protein (TIGR03085 family)
MSRYAASERHALAELLDRLGPAAPTINEGWRTRELAAHLVVRERRPDAAAGLVLRPLRGYARRVQAGYSRRPYPELIAALRRPPRWSPVSNPWLNEAANTVEFFVHHEDVRRADPDLGPRDLPNGLAAALWRRVPLLTRWWLRRFPATVTVQAPGHGAVTGGAGGEAVQVTGDPGELVLFLFGRQRVARVALDGAPDVAARLRTAEFGT